MNVLSLLFEVQNTGVSDCLCESAWVCVCVCVFACVCMHLSACTTSGCVCARLRAYLYKYVCECVWVCFPWRIHQEHSVRSAAIRSGWLYCALAAGRYCSAYCCFKWSILVPFFFFFLNCTSDYMSEPGLRLHPWPDRGVGWCSVVVKPCRMCCHPAWWTVHQGDWNLICWSH